MKLQIHNVVKITANPVAEFTRANGLAQSHEFKTRTFIIEDNKGQKFEIDVFAEIDVDLTCENLNT